MAKATKSGAAKARTSKSAAKPAAKSTRAKATIKPAAKPAADVTTPIAAQETGAIMAEATPVADIASVADQPLAAKPAKPDLSSDDEDDTGLDQDSGNELKKRELLDAIVTRTGVKKRDAKPVLEAMLILLGEAIAAGRELNLEPMGKLKTTRVKDTDNGRITILRLKQGSGAHGNDSDKQTLAEADD